jgi:hypothetical protein
VRLPPRCGPRKSGDCSLERAYEVLFYCALNRGECAASFAGQESGPTRTGGSRPNSFRQSGLVAVADQTSGPGWYGTHGGFAWTSRRQQALQQLGWTSSREARRGLSSKGQLQSHTVGSSSIKERSFSITGWPQHNGRGMRRYWWTDIRSSCVSLVQHSHWSSTWRNTRSPSRQRRSYARLNRQLGEWCRA